MTTTRDEALALDASDPLAGFRAEFTIADDSIVYLDGNSLGMPPRRTLDRVASLYDEWARDLIAGWDRWFTLPTGVGDQLAPLLGARTGEVIVHDSTSVNIYQLVRAALALRPDRRVVSIDPADFPTDRYVVDGIAAADGLEVRAGFDRLDDVAVVVRSLVDFRTAELIDLGSETARATEAGALVVWDLAHAAGAVDVDLEGAGVDLAVGCTYKFLNGGPGSPAWSYVRRSLQARIANPIQGWIGHQEPFAMGPDYVPGAGVKRLLISSPGILALVAAAAGIEVVAEAGAPAIAHKGRSLTALALELCEHFGLDSPTPRDASRRGAQVAVRVDDAARVHARLIARGVVTDLRPPDLIRVGCSALTTRFVDVYDGLAALAQEAATR